MADNSIMTNVTAVKEYGDKLKKAQQNVRDLFKKLQNDTKTISNIWKDKQFQDFKADFDNNIVKSINEVTVKMENEADYIKKIIELQRQIQAQKIR